jgi:hypothetical protein
MKRLLLLFSMVAHGLFAQTTLETNPTGLKWRQVNTPNFRVVFPKGFDFQAQRVASTLERIRSAESKTMGREPRKISIILQNQSSVSNGFVSMFPRRSEFYTMPSQNYNFTGSNDWLNLLASHEYRHVVQYQHATRGFNKMLSYLFGSPVFAAMAHAAAPDWFWEGDAVATETAFTPSGRGRMPNFDLVFRTNIVEGRTFNYHKQYLRSYKHNIPNHYVLGFHMVSYLRRRTNDPDIWEKITQRSWNVPFIPFAFSNAIRNKTGMSVTKLYREMASDLQKEWSDEIARLTLTKFETVSRRKTSAYTDYMYPQPQEDGSVVAMKQGIGDIETFVRIKDGEEEKIFIPGFLNDAGMLTTASDLIVWNEYGYDPRWQVRNYSLIKAYDWKRNVKVVVSDKESRYSSAAISPDAKRIATVRTDKNYNHRLMILNFPSGRIEKEFDNPENYFYAMPRWSDDGNRIVVIRLTRDGKTFSIIDLKTGTAEDVFPLSHENMGHPVLTKDHLFFSSPASGIDNIYVLDLKTRERYQVTSTRYGAYNPVVSPDGKYIYYNEQTRDGMDVVRIPFDPSTWKKKADEPPVTNLFDHLIEQEGGANLFGDIPQGDYPVTKFSKGAHMLNPYSWGFLVQNDLAHIDVGITSQDILSTTSITAGYTYDLNEQTGSWRAGISYQGLYPIIDLNFTQGDRSVDEDFETLVITDGDSTLVDDTYKVQWSEKNLSAGLRLPLNLTQSKYSSAVEFGYRVGVTQVTEFNNGVNSSRYFPAVIRDGVIEQGYLLSEYVTNGTFVYNQGSLFAYRLLKQSRRDINSRWGQLINIQYYGTPFGSELHGGLASATGYLYFPGLMKHHSLYGYAAFQHTKVDEEIDGDDYLFRNTVPLPRGIYDYVARHRYFTSASANYAFPLWYPDIALGPVLNIQRIRVNLFADYALGISSISRDEDNDYLSVGGELTFDINVMRFLPQIDLGVRYSYGIDPAVTKFELVIGTINF